jgi:response regulator RpfG family c-di-GMP phosphodiesterase
MYLLIIQWSIISLFLIVLIHYLYGFFQTTLTIPKIKDLVNRPASAYKEMYNTINNDYRSGNNKDSQLNKNANANSNSNKNNYTQNSESANSTNQPSSTNQNMKDELKSYLNNLSNAEPASANNVSSFDYGNAYSSY